MRPVGRAYQLVNFTDRDQAVSQPFQGGTPNDMLCRAFLCSRSVPPGQNPGVLLEKRMLAASISRICVGELPPCRGDFSTDFPLSLGIKPPSCPMLYIRWLCSESFLLHASRKDLPGYASRRQRNGKGRHCLVAWVGRALGDLDPNFPAILCTQCPNSSLLPTYLVPQNLSLSGGPVEVLGMPPCMLNQPPPLYLLSICPNYAAIPKSPSRASVFVHLYLFYSSTRIFSWDFGRESLQSAIFNQKSFTTT